jgi:hypothetical protein
VCTGCDAISVSGDVWLEPPAGLSARLATGPARFTLSYAVCPRCTPPRDDALDTVRTPDDQRRHDVAVALLSVLTDVWSAAADVVEREPWLDDDEALERAYATVVDALQQSIPPEEQETLAEALHALVEMLHDAPPPPRPPSAERALHRSASIHFRPGLDHR